MNKPLPNFSKRPVPRVEAFMQKMLVNHQSEDTHFVSLVEFPDGHYRVLFKPAYFVLKPGETEVSRSQWNSLKKKIKRNDPGVFLFKDHGAMACSPLTPDQTCYYLDFGFFSDFSVK